MALRHDENVNMKKVLPSIKYSGYFEINSHAILWMDTASSIQYSRGVWTVAAVPAFLPTEAFRVNIASAKLPA